MEAGSTPTSGPIPFTAAAASMPGQAPPVTASRFSIMDFLDGAQPQSPVSSSSYLKRDEQERYLLSLLSFGLERWDNPLCSAIVSVFPRNPSVVDVSSALLKCQPLTL